MTSSSAASLLEDNDDLFINGCFWQVKHHPPKPNDASSPAPTTNSFLAGYTSGKSSVSGKVGYHSASNIAGYVSLRHTEVVSLRMPPLENSLATGSILRQAWGVLEFCGCSRGEVFDVCEIVGGGQCEDGR
ncbi:hypothetical protein HJC23_009212 [Cyclotella cryptica]|uniref:Uncharacterized protein n=1 Tax=Cyclotella cryptica TaxID=29204 RepID=A0ABD3P193_9STRA